MQVAVETDPSDLISDLISYSSNTFSQPQIHLIISLMSSSFSTVYAVVGGFFNIMKTTFDFD